MQKQFRRCGMNIDNIPVLGFINDVVIGAILETISEKISLMEVPFIGAIIGFVVGSLGWIILAYVGATTGGAAGVVGSIIGISFALIFGISGGKMGFTGSYKRKKRR